MEAVIGLMLMILGVSHGVETHCDGRQNESQCYGALGGTVVLRLMDSTSEISRYEWSKKHTIILHGRKNKTVSNLIESRSSFTPSDGIFRINNLSQTDDGEYTLKIFDSKGHRSVQTTLQLTIKETVCDGRRDGAHCYGALGGTMILQLMDSTSEETDPSDGTFRINNLNSTDDGEYTLETFDSSGQKLALRTLHLTIHAPVSSVLLVSECLSQGEMRVACSSEGANSPQYSWTLDGRALTDAQLLSGNKESNNITLRQDVSGRLVCSVSNLISRISTCGLRSTDCRLFSKMHLSQKMLVSSDTQCFEETSADSTVTEGCFLFFCGARTAVVILVLSGIFIFWVWKKKYKKAEDSTIPRRMDHEDDSVVVLEMRSSASEL